MMLGTTNIKEHTKFQSRIQNFCQDQDTNADNHLNGHSLFLTTIMQPVQSTLKTSEFFVLKIMSL